MYVFESTIFYYSINSINRSKTKFVVTSTKNFFNSAMISKGSSFGRFFLSISSLILISLENSVYVNL